MTELEQLRMENKRLYESRDRYKHDWADEVIRGMKWRIRAYVVEDLLRYLNGINPWWYPEDLTKEIDIQVSHRFELYKRREIWTDDLDCFKKARSEKAVSHGK